VYSGDNYKHLKTIDTADKVYDFLIKDSNYLITAEKSGIIEVILFNLLFIDLRYQQIRKGV
jgi:hypothetical protein